MDCSRALVGAGLAAYLVGQVSHASAFAPALPGPSAASAAGLASSGAQASAGAPVPQGGGSLVIAAAAVGAAVGGVRRRGLQRVAMKVSGAATGGMRPSGPVVAYAKALLDTAAAKKESVTVTKDVMKVKKLFRDEEFLNKLQYVVNAPMASDLEKANGMVELMQPMESAVFPKFVIFLAKKKRLGALRGVCAEYVCSLYTQQSIAPVYVRTSQRLTTKQINTIKSKMKAKTGASDIKLVAEVDPNLLGGLIIEWGYLDPESLDCPTEGMDLSLRTALSKAAMNEGVVVQV